MHDYSCVSDSPGWFASPGLDERDSSSQTVSTDAAPACVHAIGVVADGTLEEGRSYLADRPTRSAEERKSSARFFVREST